MRMRGKPLAGALCEVRFCDRLFEGLATGKSTQKEAQMGSEKDARGSPCARFSSYDWVAKLARFADEPILK